MGWLPAWRHEVPAGEPPPSPGYPATGFGPDAVEVGARALRLGEWLVPEFRCRRLPREVGLGWLEPLTTTPVGSTCRCTSIPSRPPWPPTVCAAAGPARISRRADAAKGRLGDPEIEVAAADARDLAAGWPGRAEALSSRAVRHRACPGPRVARGRVRPGPRRVPLDAVRHPGRPRGGPCRVGYHLAGGCRRLVHAAEFRHRRPGRLVPFRLGRAVGHLRRPLRHGRPGFGLVLWDRFAQDNHNSVILARSGAGKSYLAKLEALRSVYAGIGVCVIDPEDEYRRLADAVGGAYLHLGAPGIRLNPFDLDTRPDALVRRALFLHTLIAVLVAEPLGPATKAALDRGSWPPTPRWGSRRIRPPCSPAPLLADLASALEEDGDDCGPPAGPAPGPLRHRHPPGIVRRATTTRPDGHLWSSACVTCLTPQKRPGRCSRWTPCGAGVGPDSSPAPPGSGR